MQKYGVIYLIRNNINNKIYIGQTIQDFDKRYSSGIEKTHNKHLKRSIEKYGVDNFYIDKEFDIAYSQDELNRLEKMYIRMYNATDKRYGYNIREGGLNTKLAESTKQKLSEARLGRFKGEENPMFGKHHTEESKKKMAVNKGKPMSEEQKEKLRNNSPRSRQVICLDDNKIFKSIKEASRYYNIDNSSIGKVCRGVLKHVHGLHFSYVA